MAGTESVAQVGVRVVDAGVDDRNLDASPRVAGRIGRLGLCHRGRKGKVGDGLAGTERRFAVGRVGLVGNRCRKDRVDRGYARYGRERARLLDGKTDRDAVPEVVEGVALLDVESLSCR